MPDPLGCDALGSQIARRAYGEFLEMPGLRLTVAQAQRLWGLDTRSCRQLLDALVEARLLAPPQGGVYGRPISAASSLPRAAGSRGGRP